jgi:hypothetical protein
MLKDAVFAHATMAELLKYLFAGMEQPTGYKFEKQKIDKEHA